MDFKTFVTLTESYEKDLKKTLKKLPKRHSQLVAKHRFVFQPGNELKGDGEHIGIIDNKRRTITVAAPWNFGREMTVLHEIGHLVWNILLTKEQQQKWAKIAKRTKLPKDAKQNPEELFCMAYGATYAHRPPAAYLHDEWERFIKALPK
jgi:hypothetical protein